MDNNIFYDLLFKGIDNPKDVTRDSLEIILNRITDLHNAMGQSFEYLVDIISTLMNNPGQLKPSKPASKSGVSEDEAQALRNEIMGLGDELREVKDRAMHLEKQSKEKDKIIQELQRKFEEANNRQSENVIREQHPMSEEDIPKEEAQDKEEMVSSFRRRLGEFNNKVNNDERLEVEEEPEEEKDEMEENNGLNLYKFKKTFRKMKSNESESEAINSGSAPFLAALNGKRNSDLSLGRSSQMKLDEDANLNSLLNNFIGDKGSPLRGFSSNKFTAVQKKENDGSQSDNVFPSGKIFNSYQINKDKNSKNNNSGKSDLFGQNLSFKQVGLTEKSNTKSTEAGKTGSGPGLIQKMLNGKNKKKKGGLESLLQSQDANEEDDNNNKATGIGVNYLSFKEVLFKRKSDQGNAHDFE